MANFMVDWFGGEENLAHAAVAQAAAEAHWAAQPPVAPQPQVAQVAQAALAQQVAVPPQQDETESTNRFTS